jgi:hypothetical protein
MLKSTSFAILLISAVAAGAQSQTSSCGLACAVAPAPAPQAAPARGNQSDLDKVVCKAQDTLGTRLGAKKVCMTVAQWQAYEDDVKDQTRRIQQVPLVGSEPQ